ncbi:MAG: DegV family protein [Clostridia bacterium]|nr:DegV family protein [Clostridia bacterium]
MAKVGIVTDNSCGLTAQEAQKLNIKMGYIPFLINGEEYSEDKNLTQELFYEKLNSSASVSTSQPNQEVIKSIWNEALKEYDEIVYIPLSSGLSSTYQSSEFSSLEYNGKVQVINNKRVSVTLKLAVLEALELAKQGKSAKEIKQILENNALNATIYIMVPTLKYLKKGGRVTPAAAAIGSLLNIKPVLQIQGDKLDAYAKVLTIKQAKSKMINAIKKDIETRFINKKPNQTIVISLAHSCLDLKDFNEFKQEVEYEFNGYPIMFSDPLPLSIACHTGPGAIGLTCCLVDNKVVNNY